MRRPGVQALAFLLAWVLWITPGRAGNTVVVWDFENNTVGPMRDIQAAEPLARILPEVLLSNLGRHPEIPILERVRLREILEELKLGTSGLSDEETRLRLGRIFGAKAMVFGEYVTLAGLVRADIRLVEVETGKILFSEPLLGDEGTVLDGTQACADKIARFLLDDAGSPDAGKRFPADLWNLYNKGLQHMDRKEFELAIDVFKNLLVRHPDFKPAERQLKLSLERLARH